MLDAEMDGQAADLETRYDAVDDNARLALAFSHLAENNLTLDVLSRYETRARGGFDRALRNLVELQARQQAPQWLCPDSLRANLASVESKIVFCRTNPPATTSRHASAILKGNRIASVICILRHLTRRS